MKTMKLSKEQRDQVILLIQQYFEKERGEIIGDLAADSVMDFFMSHMAPIVYNQALSDSRYLVRQHMTSLEDDLYSLEQQVKQTRSR
ncbi:DUF2164 domain-containing protein [Paenibacillus sp. IHBB 10380]|uniref:DUF2164 domain-containing protein n=1 Tax=Paenibacillus sp. IHBB 10380 TaxID=1566358 RepID=UPI0005CFEBF8|nr:DUF2164 domain-containing protein [Paenibacillus sp. IHBB 10380]AJS60429.1 hypothetical protein UB51_20460 [Paenibacillus sp. IHBB 10380]